MGRGGTAGSCLANCRIRAPETVAQKFPDLARLTKKMLTNNLIKKELNK